MRRSLDRCRVCDRLEDVHTAAELAACAGALERPREADGAHSDTPSPDDCPICGGPCLLEETGR